jgi:hypothetical protein
MSFFDRMASKAGAMPKLYLQRTSNSNHHLMWLSLVHPMLLGVFNIHSLRLQYVKKYYDYLQRFLVANGHLNDTSKIME